MTTETRRPGRRRRIECVGTVADHSRLFNCLLHLLVHRLERRRRAIYGDLDSALLLESIGLFAVEGVLRDPKWLKKYRSYNTSMGLDQRGTNMLSAAEAAGVPRETARRKLHKLVKRGILTEVRPNEYVVTPGFPQSAKMRERLEHAMADVLRFVNECLELGVFQWSETEEQSMENLP
jgi:hypothetical protein